MKKEKLKIAFYGSSLVSAYWNGAATYYRGIIKALHKLGHEVIFFEPDAYGRQEHRDIPDPDYAKVVVYQTDEESVHNALRQSKGADIIIKASGVGVFEELLEEQVLQYKTVDQIVIYWDVDAPATLARLEREPDYILRNLIPEYDLVLTYGGGAPVVQKYKSFGAKECVPVYNGLDLETHHPAAPQKRFSCDLAFLGNRLPDREERVGSFFLKAAELLPDKHFILGGSGWDDKTLPPNVKYIGHVYTKDHNALNCSAKAVLNISRSSMAENGFSPATRVFEVAGAGACLITDDWKGIEMFLEPGKEVLVAKDGHEVAAILRDLDEKRARKIGRAAFKRMLKENTYTHRAEELEKILLACKYQITKNETLEI